MLAVRMVPRPGPAVMAAVIRSAAPNWRKNRISTSAAPLASASFIPAFMMPNSPTETSRRPMAAEMRSLVSGTPGA